MAVRLWPKEYSRKDHISKEERFLLRGASNNFKDGHFAVDIDPLGLSTPDCKMGMYISPTEGLITFSVFNGDFDASFAIGYLAYHGMVEQKIYERLLDSKMLIVRNGAYKALKFPYKHVLLFPDEKAGHIIVSEEKKEQLNPFIAYGFFRPLMSDGTEHRVSDLQIFANVRLPYDTAFSELNEIECKAIFERLAPEYTIVMAEMERVEVPEKALTVSDDKMKITGKELEYKTFFLDEYQVGLVNDMGKGHRVILANPGAGKSVLLLSKAFKYASMYKSSKILLTCYNNNLADSYAFKRSCANFGDNHNLFIMTFHKLVKKIYEECLHSHCETNIATEDEIRECIRKVKDGTVKLRFKAIFIDEVQVFDPLYLELCYALLDMEDQDRVFLMAGDLNQAVREQSRHGEAPWKKINGVHLDFTGRVRYIEKNYRNSVEIAQYIQRMLSHMNDRMDIFGLIEPDEYAYNSFKAGHNSTIALKVQTGISRMDMKKTVIDAVQEISAKYKTSYSDIAILFPNKKQPLLRYYFLYWVQTALDKENIPYSLITTDENHPYEKKKFSETEGVILSTVESSLGLDFKAVIVAGLYPYNYVFSDNGRRKEISSWSAIQKMTAEEKAKVQSQMRSIYTACSRARDILYVLSDLKPDSPMEEILKK